MRKLFGILILLTFVVVPLSAKSDDLRQQCYAHVHDWLLAETARCDTLGESAAGQCIQNAVNQANLDNAVCDTLDN